jgi:glycosyltransferase involved in cell wall biosynthesis
VQPRAHGGGGGPRLRSAGLTEGSPVQGEGTQTWTHGSISACLLCHNDAPTIGALVFDATGALDQLGAPGEIVVVDDGSTDSSRERLLDSAALEPRLRVIEHGSNRGYGGALRTALSSARGDWVFYTDGDGQYDPAELARLAAKVSPEVDVVQGYKGRRADGVLRRFVGWAYKLVARRMFSLSIRDPDCDFRLMRSELVRGLGLTRDTGAVCVELVRALEDAGARVVEVEVSHHPRRVGRSQFFRPANIARALADLAGLWLAIVSARVRRPARRR